MPSQTAFASVPYTPPDPIFELTAAFNADTCPQKVNLGQGTYRDENAKPWILTSVEKAKEVIAAQCANHEYLPILGSADFRSGAAKLVFGTNSPLITEGRIASAQSVSGTGAVHLAALFLKENYSADATVYITSPTWSNHRALFESVGFTVEEYKYYDDETRGVAFQSILDCANNANEGSIFVLHPCAHNPTGCDLSIPQWKELAKVFLSRNLIPVLDAAYQGFASGSLDTDAWTIRYFLDECQMTGLVCQSFSKSMGLYGERVGCLHIACTTAEIARNVQSQVAWITRREISNPPAFGATIASTILNSDGLYKLWEQDLVKMSGRIKMMRKAVLDGLVAKGTPGTWNHVVDQIGMFSFTGLTPSQVKWLAEKKSIYMADNGRISIAGLNGSNVDYFVSAVDEAVRTH